MLWLAPSLSPPAQHRTFRTTLTGSMEARAPPSIPVTARPARSLDRREAVSLPRPRTNQRNPSSSAATPASSPSSTLHARWLLKRIAWHNCYTATALIEEWTAKAEERITARMTMKEEKAYFYSDVTP